MSHPVFMVGTDISGLQPSCSIITSFTRAAGLGYPDFRTTLVKLLMIRPRNI